MRGIGWVVILLGLLTVSYLVVRDLGVLQGERGGKAVIEPLERSKEVAELIEQTQGSLQESLDKIDR